MNLQQTSDCRLVPLSITAEGKRKRCIILKPVVGDNFLPELFSFVLQTKHSMCTCWGAGNVVHSPASFAVTGNASVPSIWSRHGESQNTVCNGVCVIHYSTWYRQPCVHVSTSGRVGGLHTHEGSFADFKWTVFIIPHKNTEHSLSDKTKGWFPKKKSILIDHDSSRQAGRGRTNKDILLDKRLRYWTGRPADQTHTHSMLCWLLKAYVDR